MALSHRERTVLPQTGLCNRDVRAGDGKAREGGPRCGGSEMPLKAHSPPSRSPAWAPAHPPWTPGPLAGTHVQQSREPEWALQRPDTEMVSPSGSHFFRVQNPLEAPVDLLPAPKSEPRRRDALDSPSHWPELGRGRLSGASPRPRHGAGGRLNKVGTLGRMMPRRQSAMAYIIL